MTQNPRMGVDEMSLDALPIQASGKSLSGPDREALLSALAGTKHYRRGATMVCAGDHPSELHLITSGWAARSVTLKSGSREITDFLIAGDLCDLSAIEGGQMGQVDTLCDVTVELLDRRRLVAAMQDHRGIAAMLMNIALREQAILRVWLTCLGAQQRLEHVAHLFCELHERLRRVHLVGDHSFDLPLTQEVIADATGMPTVHTNPVLQRLRKSGFISLHSQHLDILQPLRLREIAGFEAEYLAN